MAGITPRPLIRVELPCHGTRNFSRHNLVFGGVEKTHDHDAVMRISGEAPGRRDHSVERQKPGTSAVYRHLGSRSDIHLSLENARFWLALTSRFVVSRQCAAQYLRGF